jgi:2'-5' RNA ligase
MSEGTAKDRGARSPTLRAFVAVPLPAAVRAAILAVVHDVSVDATWGLATRPAGAAGERGARLPGGSGGLAARLPDLRWSRRAENLHVTLKFLGQVEPALLARFCQELAAALRVIPGFAIQLRGFGAFPSLRDAQVVWVGVDDPARRLEQVAAIVEEVAARPSLQLGGDPALRRRLFRAHVTVARAPRRSRRSVDATAALAPTADLTLGGAPVNEVHVYESITGGDASTYILRGSATLEGATHGDRQDRDQGRN